MVAQNEYRRILKEALEARCSRNPRYSLRAFARDLGVSAPRLSHLLNGKQGLSGESAEKIAVKLGMNAEETKRFAALADAEHARGSLKRKIAQDRLKELTASNYTSLTVDSFKAISDWYHFGILELVDVADFKSDLDWIAKRLGISRYEAETAIERLIRMGALSQTKGGVLKKEQNFAVNPAGIPSEAVRKGHTQVLTKAIGALDLQTVDERDFSNIILAINPDVIPLAKERIKEFRRKFDQEFGSMERKKSVYAIAIQFFSLDTFKEKT